jgi:uncharacterized protein
VGAKTKKATPAGPPCQDFTIRAGGVGGQHLLESALPSPTLIAARCTCHKTVIGEVAVTSIIPGEPMRQIAVLPYRVIGSETDARAEVLLVTSRETRRWVTPKGNIAAGELPHHAAAREALEEAGVSGAVFPTRIGQFQYPKRRRNGSVVIAAVDLFPLAVTHEHSSWPEMAERERQWFGLAAAAEAVDEPDLKLLIRAFDPQSLDAAGPAQEATSRDARVSFFTRAYNRLRRRLL